MAYYAERETSNSVPAICTILFSPVYLFCSYNQKLQFLLIGVGTSLVTCGGWCPFFFKKITQLPYCSCAVVSNEHLPFKSSWLSSLKGNRKAGKGAKKIPETDQTFFLKLTRAAANLPFLIAKLYWILCCVISHSEKGKSHHPPPFPSFFATQASLWIVF